MIEFHPVALDEIEEAYEYLYLHADCETADAFRAGVERKLAECHASPMHYRIRHGSVRRANLERFKEYYVAFMMWNGRFVVIALGHAKRRPFYWRSRPAEFRSR